MPSPSLRSIRSINNFLTATERSALTIGEDHGRSIGGRLGGHFDSIRSTIPIADDDIESDEATRLLVQSTRKHIVSPPPPALAVWITPALSCAAAYAFYNIFIKKGSASINPILGGVVLQFVAALLGTVLLGSTMLHSNNKGGAYTDMIQYDAKGLTWSVFAGLAVGTAEMLSFIVSGMGVQATQFIPIIIGGSVMFGAVLGVLMLGEKMMLHGWFGVAMLVSGIAMVATDPGDKMVEEGGVGVGVGDGDNDSPPPLSAWIAPALLCAVAYAFYNIFIKKGSASINPILGGVVLQFVAAIFGSLLLGGIVLFVDGGDTSQLEYDNTGLFWAILAGLAVGTAELLSFVVSGMGVNATQSIPVIIGGSVMFGAVLGLLILGETMMLQGWFGVLVLMTGIGFVATDPGEKVAGH
jgi:transporter family protein